MSSATDALIIIIDNNALIRNILERDAGDTSDSCFNGRLMLRQLTDLN